MAAWYISVWVKMIKMLSQEQTMYLWVLGKATRVDWIILRQQMEDSLIQRLDLYRLSVPSRKGPVPRLRQVKTCALVWCWPGHHLWTSVSLLENEEILLILIGWLWELHESFSVKGSGQVFCCGLYLLKCSWRSCGPRLLLLSSMLFRYCKGHFFFFFFSFSWD